ncbi:hypothetical protein ATCC90586_003557 [Pythium insidiosum]|nr:hypothetical protein ATCC90586_003557 [Pythium insidiosum]
MMGYQRLREFMTRNDESMNVDSVEKLLAFPTKRLPFVPWSDHPWPHVSDGLNHRWRSPVEPSPAEKYAMAFGLDVLDFTDRISSISGVDSGVGACTESRDCPTGLECAYRRNASTGRCLSRHDGLHDAWGRASIEMEAPVAPVVKNGVTFYPQDIKALVSQLYFNSHRLGEQRNISLYAVDEGACRDITPSLFHGVLLNVVGRLNAPLLFRLSTKSSFAPIYQYRLRELRHLDMDAAEKEFGTFRSHYDRPLDIVASAVVVTIEVDWILAKVDQDDDLATDSAAHAVVSLWDDPIMAGRHIPNSHIQDIRVLGAGAYGVVYLVGVHGRQLAASKRLATGHADDAEMQQGLVGEIKLHATLHHPNIIALLGASWTTRTDLQALFEFAPCGDLRTYLSSESTAWAPQKLALALDVALALAYLHSRAVLHRDLKSRNILLSTPESPAGTRRRDGGARRLVAKLGDFGVARGQSIDGSMTTGVGTSRWLAPEVVLGGGDYGAACDVYSFGAVLTELDTHELPFFDAHGPDGRALTDVALLLLVAAEGLQPSVSASCPPPIAALARRCLAFHARDRPTAPELCSILGGIMARSACVGKDNVHGPHTHPELVFDGDEVVRRFALSRGRAPTADEERQLREHGHTHEHLEHAGVYEHREQPIVEQIVQAFHEK